MDPYKVIRATLFDIHPLSYRIKRTEPNKEFMNKNLFVRVIKQLQRIVGLCKVCLNSKIFPICSTVYMNKKAITELKKLKIIAIKIERDFNKIKKTKTYKYKKNVVGIDLHYEKNFNHLVLKNATKKNLFKELKSFFL